MPLVTGLLRERVAHLLVALLLTHNLKVATATSVSLTVKQPQSVFGDVVIVDSAKYPLIAIVNCTGTQLQANVNKEESTLYSNGSLKVQLEKGNKPNEYFLLPNNSGKTLPEGEYQVDLLCSNLSTQETNNILVSVILSATATDSPTPYFIDSQRTVTISASTPPGSVVTSFKAEFPGSLQSGTKEYAVHEAFSRAPFQMNGLSGDLVLERSLLVEGTLPRYDIVIVADQGHHEAWTLTTIIIMMPPPAEASPTAMPMDCGTAGPTAASTGSQYAFTALIAVVAVLAVLFLLSLLVIIFLVICVARLNKQKRITMEVKGEKQAIVSSQFANVSLDDQLKSPTANSGTAFL